MPTTPAPEPIQKPQRKVESITAPAPATTPTLHPGNFRHIVSGIDVTSIVKQLEAYPEAWEADRYWKHHPLPTFREVDSVILRFPHKAPYQFRTLRNQAAYNEKHDWKECFDQPIYAAFPAVRSVVTKLMAMVNGERLGRVMINRLPPGCSIPPHTDIAPELKYYDRYHVALRTNAKTTLSIGADHCYIPVGDVWWFENAAEHYARNTGDTDRWHLIVDIRTKEGTGVFQNPEGDRDDSDE